MGSLKKLFKRVTQPPKHSSRQRYTRTQQGTARLPNELIFDIFELAIEQDGPAARVPAAAECSVQAAQGRPHSTTVNDAAPSRQAMLATLARVSKLCRDWAEQELYKSPVISSPLQARRFKRTVDRDIMESHSSSSKQRRERFRLLRLVEEIVLQGHGAVFHVANLVSTFRRSTLAGLGGRAPSVTLRNTTIPTFFAFAAIAETLQHLTFDNVLLADRTLTARYHPFFVTFNTLERLDLHSTKIELDTARIFLSHTMLPALSNLTMDHVKLLKDFEEAQDPELRMRRPVDEDASAMGVDEDVEVFDAFLLGQLERLSLAGREGRRAEEDQDDEQDENDERERDVLANFDLNVNAGLNDLASNDDGDDDESDAETIRLNVPPRQQPQTARLPEAPRTLWTVERRMLAQCHVLRSLTLDYALEADEDDLRRAVPSPLLA
ncbi:hypothetical protein ACM66B_001849 [Microbotryomycetes sp. NB124-2]